MRRFLGKTKFSEIWLKLQKEPCSTKQIWAVFSRVFGLASKQNEAYLSLLPGMDIFYPLLCRVIFVIYFKFLAVLQIT